MYFFFQRGDILLSINDKTLVGKTHGEAIESVRGLIGCEVVRMELIQGEETDINGGLSPDWGKWLRKWEVARRRYMYGIIILYRKTCDKRKGQFLMHQPI